MKRKNMSNQNKFLEVEPALGQTLPKQNVQSAEKIF